MNEHKSKARIIEKIFQNRINDKWYTHSSDEIEKIGTLL